MLCVDSSSISGVVTRRVVTGSVQFNTGCMWLLEPHDHARMLHPEQGSIGMITIAEQPTPSTWLQKSIPVTKVSEVLREYQGRRDIFISMNRFTGKRTVAGLLQIGAVWCDLDYYKTDLANAHPWAVRDLALQKLQECQIPAPNISISTGRGLAMVWLHDPVPRAALPRWMACQRHLNDCLAEFGADHFASDAARVMRVIGTVNSRSGTLVEGDFASTHRWPFDDLADELLPMKRGEVRSLALERAKLRTKKSKTAPGFAKGRLSASALWEGRLSALQYWRRNIRFRGALPPGNRDNWLFWAANAMAYMVPCSVLDRELHALAEEVAGWDIPESNSRLQAIFKRATALARGETIEWMGKKVSPLYRAHNETILDHIGITEEEQLKLLEYFGKPILCNSRIVREYKTGQEKKRRRKKGSVSREEYEEEARIKHKKALQLRAEGMKQREIADELGISERWVRNLLKSKPE